MESKTDHALIPWGRDCQFQEHVASRDIFEWDADRDQVRNRRKTTDHYSKLHQPLHYPQPKSWCQLSDFGNTMQASSALSRWQKERSWCGNGSLAASASTAGSSNGPGMDFIFNMWEVYMPCAGFWEGKNTASSSELNQMDSHRGMNQPPLAHMHSGSSGHMFSPAPPAPSQSPHPPSMNHHPMSGPENLSPVSQHAPLLSGMTSQSSSAANQTSPLVIPRPTKPPGTTIKTYHCRMCDQIFDSKSDLLVHSQHIHKQDPKPYKCQTCQKCFANSSYLSQHARIHTGVKPYRCTICERRFTQLCHLQQHIRTHTGEKPYKCQHPGCGKAFSQLSNLQSHSRSHMTDKPYRCNSCYKCFTDEQSLREHIPKHSETKHLKTNICKICGKSYTQETYLARHMTKHSAGEVSSRALMNNQKALHHSMSTPSMPTQQGSDLHDLKSTMEQGFSNGGSGLRGSLDSGRGMTSPNTSPSSSSAFMPLPQYPSSNMSSLINSSNFINSTMPSNFPFASPRIPSTLSSPLSHISPPPTVSSRSYFPFDPLSMPKGGAPDMDRTSHLHMQRNLAASNLLSLQQIKDFSTSHPVFPKSEPSSPVHCHKDFT